MSRQVFADGTVLLTGDDMTKSLMASLNRRDAYDIDCSFCLHEGNESHCGGCSIADTDYSCSCHINPPCGKCVNSKFEVSPYLINYEAHKGDRKNWQCFKADKAVFDNLASIEGSGLHLSAEVLTTGEAAMYIEDGVEKDYEIEICARRDFKETMCRMIMTFSLENDND